MGDYIEQITWRYHAEMAASIEADEKIDADLDLESQLREHVRSPHGVVHVVQGMTTLCGWHTEGWWTLDPMAMVTCKRCEQNATGGAHG